MGYIDQLTINSVTYDIQDAAVPSWARASSAPVESINNYTGIVTLTANDVGALASDVAIPSIATDIGAIPAPSSATTDAVLAYNGTAWVADKRMVILAYGSSTWTDFINAYNNNAVIYCRASSNSNPATGAQTRMAFMAYVNSATPTNVEFQYYRSVNSHSAAQQGDQVFIYKLDKTSGWSVTTREAYTKIAVGTGLSSSYSSGTLTLSNSLSAPKTASLTIPYANWTGNGPYTQTIIISGATITSHTKVDIQLDETAFTQIINDGVAAMFVKNNSGTLTLYAISAATTADITIQVTYYETV